MSTPKKGTAAHYDAIAEHYGEQYRRENLISAAEYPANFFRLEILKRRLAHAQCKSVYEVGVGEGTPLVEIAKLGIRVAGCDIANNMVNAARQNFQAHGLNPDSVQWGNIEDRTSFQNQLADGQFDAAIAAGVLPHINDDALFLKNLALIVRPGGKIFVEFRNKLFSLFTFNRYTKDFILDDLLAQVSADTKKAVADELNGRIATDLPPVRKTVEGSDAPGYDTILSKFHNPFEIIPFFEQRGYRNPTIHWYHYHPAPPMLERSLGRKFREDGMALEHENSWRGYFLCSAGVVEAERHAP